MGHQEFKKLVANYYSGELVILSFKLLISTGIVLLVFLLRQYSLDSIIQYFSYNVFVIFGIIIAKSIFQFVQYYHRKSRIQSTENYKKSTEEDYISKREYNLTIHRRLHVYSIAICLFALIIIFYKYQDSTQIFAMFLGILLASIILLGFSLFNSFRLSEYKFQLGGKIN